MKANSGLAAFSLLASHRGGKIIDVVFDIVKEFTQGAHVVAGCAAVGKAVAVELVV